MGNQEWCRCCYFPIAVRQNAPRPLLLNSRDDDAIVNGQAWNVIVHEFKHGGDHRLAFKVHQFGPTNSNFVFAELSQQRNGLNDQLADLCR